MNEEFRANPNLLDRFDFSSPVKRRYDYAISPYCIERWTKSMNSPKNTTSAYEISRDRNLWLKLGNCQRQCMMG